MTTQHSHRLIGAFMKWALEEVRSQDEMEVNVDDYVDAWHLGQGHGCTLDEFLGFTTEEGAIWARYPSRLIEIMESRRKHG